MNETTRTARVAPPVDVLRAQYWRGKHVKGALPVGDMHMPYLRKLYLYFNKELKGEAGRG